MISDSPLAFILDLTGRISLDEAVNFAGTSKLLVHEGGTIHIGKSTFFNRGCSLNALDKIEIGEHCLFGENVKIYDHNHRFDMRDKLIRDQGYTKASVIIGNDTWIGSNVVILKGVVIGNHVVIGANCVVSMNIPDHSLVTLIGSNLSIKPILLK